MSICDWDAPGAEAVNDVLKTVLGAPPVDGTVVVKPGPMKGNDCGRMGGTDVIIKEVI